MDAIGMQARVSTKDIILTEFFQELSVYYKTLTQTKTFVEPQQKKLDPQRLALLFAELEEEYANKV